MAVATPTAPVKPETAPRSRARKPAYDPVAIAERAHALVPGLSQKPAPPSAARLAEMVGKTDPLVYAGFPADADPAKSQKALLAWSRGKLDKTDPVAVMLKERVRTIRADSGMFYTIWGRKIGALLAAMAEAKAAAAEKP